MEEIMSFEAKIDKEMEEYERKLLEIRKKYKLDELDLKELSLLEEACRNIYGENKKAEEREELAKLKDLYENKYFLIGKNTICYIDYILNKYQLFGWELKRDTCPAFADKQGQQWTIRHGHIGSYLTGRFAMSGKKIDEAPISGAEELKKEEAEKILNDILNGIKRGFGAGE